MVLVLLLVLLLCAAAAAAARFCCFVWLLLDFSHCRPSTHSPV